MSRLSRFPMRLQFFAEDTGVDTVAGLDDLLNQMDNPEGTTEENADTAGVTEETEDEAEDTSEQTEEPAQPAPKEKANVAFAQMRTQLSQQKNLLTKVAQAMGIEFTNETDLFKKLNDNALSELAKKQNVPIELMQRLEALEQDSKELQQTKLQDAAYLGFQKVMANYGLTQDELTVFAAELDELGKNPFVTPMDVEAEYKVLHLEDIINKRVEKAVQTALSKSQAADKHSTTPVKQKGSAPNTKAPVDTVSGLDEFLKGLN